MGHYLGHLTSLPDGELVVVGEFSEDAGYTQAGRCGTGEETREKREHPQTPTQVGEVALIRGPRGSLDVKVLYYSTATHESTFSGLGFAPWRHARHTNSVSIPG